MIELKNLLNNNTDFENTPILILANKKDLPSAMNEDEIKHMY